MKPEGVRRVRRRSDGRRSEPRQSPAAAALRYSGDLLPPSPPAEKATARQDQTGKSGTGDGTRYSYGRKEKRLRERGY
jgi:hypothetical protein